MKQTELHAAVVPNTITSQGAGKSSNAGVEQIWSHVSFAKHSEDLLPIIENR